MKHAPIAAYVRVCVCVCAWMCLCRLHAHYNKYYTAHRRTKLSSAELWCDAVISHQRLADQSTRNLQ